MPAKTGHGPHSSYFLCCSMYFFCVVLCDVYFVTFPVLFVCIYVLNNCHRVATQLQLNIYIYQYQLSDIFKGVILRNFVSKISNLTYVFIYCAVQWRFCCHSAAICVSVLVTAQALDRHRVVCIGFKTPEVRIIIMELLFIYFFTRRPPRRTLRCCTSFVSKARSQLITANKTHGAVRTVRTLHS
jgi:hypothetical protein